MLDIDWGVLHNKFLGEELINYIWCFGIIISTLLLKKPAAALLSRVSSTLTERFSHSGRKRSEHIVIRKPMERLLQVVLYYIAINRISGLLDQIELHNPTSKKRIQIQAGDLLDHLFLLLFIIFLTQVISRIIDFVFSIRQDKAEHENDKSQEQLLPFMREVVNLVLWTLSTFWILGSVFQVNIPALITGLGIGGIAIALAGKTTVENLFAAFTILSDKPFQSGDTIKLADMEGKVERIGFRSTRLRTSDGIIYIIPNQNLVGGNLANLSLRSTKVLKVAVNIKYGLSHQALQQVIEEIRKTLLATDPVKEPIEVSLENFAENTFQLLVSYSVPDPLPEKYTLSSVTRKVNLDIFEIVTRYTDKNAATIENAKP